MNRRELVLGGLALFASACVKPAPIELPEEVTIDSIKPFATFPHGVIANFTELPITVYPKNLERVTTYPLYGVNARYGQVGFFVISSSDSADNSHILNSFLDYIKPNMRKQYVKEQGKIPVSELTKAISLPRFYKTNFTPVPLIDINLPILAYNLGLELNLKWARFMYSEVRRRSKIPYAGEDLNPDALRQLCFDKLFSVSDLSYEMAQSLSVS